MSDSNWYLGFGASPTLYALYEAYGEALAAGSDREQTEKLLALLSQFADECLNQYFIQPIERVRLNPVGRKIVSGGVAAMKKTIHLTLRQVVKKLSRDDRQQLAAYFDGLLKPLRQSQRYPTYVAVAISPQLRSRLSQAVATGRTEGVETVTEDYAGALCELVDVALQGYMTEPLRMLRLGPVLGRITKVAQDAIRSTAHTVIRKVIPAMSDQEMQGFFEFSESILYPHPR
ncbi:MAG: hypothetical protein SV765_14340 [Pseudomonadota bacterium]|nr:hypothetical protein [Pseudomonadota bacterium]